MKKDVLNTAAGKAHRMMKFQPDRITSVIQVSEGGEATEKFTVTERDNPSERRGNLTAEQLLQKTGYLNNRTRGKWVKVMNLINPLSSKPRKTLIAFPFRFHKNSAYCNFLMN